MRASLHCEPLEFIGMFSILLPAHSNQIGNMGVAWGIGRHLVYPHAPSKFTIFFKTKFLWIQNSACLVAPGDAILIYGTLELYVVGVAK